MSDITLHYISARQLFNSLMLALQLKLITDLNLTNPAFNRNYCFLKTIDTGKQSLTGKRTSMIWN